MLNNIDSALQLTASHHSVRRSAFSPTELPNSNAHCFLTLSQVCYMSFLSESHSVSPEGVLLTSFYRGGTFKTFKSLTYVHNQFSGQARQNQVSIPDTLPWSLDAITTHHSFGHTGLQKFND